MKKLYTTLLTTLLLATTAMAQSVVTFTAGVDVGTQTNAANGADQVAKDGVTISVTTGAFAAPQYRIAKGQTVSISVAEGAITAIRFECVAEGDAKYGPGCFAAHDGYTYEGNVGNWVGSAQKVELVAETAQVRATKIIVAIDGEAIPEEEPNNDNGDWASTVSEPLSVPTVLTLSETLGADARSPEVYVAGIVSEITEVSVQYGNATYYISADGETDTQLLVFRGYSYDGEKFTAEDELQVGDHVIVVGSILNYRGTTIEVATGSKLVKADEAAVASLRADKSGAEGIFTLAGQRVGSITKAGLYIRDGKKVVVR